MVGFQPAQRRFHHLAAMRSGRLLVPAFLPSTMLKPNFVAISTLFPRFSPSARPSSSSLVYGP